MFNFFKPLSLVTDMTTHGNWHDSSDFHYVALKIKSILNDKETDQGQEEIILIKFQMGVNDLILIFSHVM